MAVSATRRKKREEVVREHMDSENRHEFDATIATFERPRYELIGTGEVYDGAVEVERYFEETRRAFPRPAQRAARAAPHRRRRRRRGGRPRDHKGPLRNLPPTGREFELPILAMFLFEGTS